jgi:hypothetical protein
MGLRTASAPKRHASIAESSQEHLKHADALSRKRKTRSKKLPDEPKVEYHMPVLTVGLESLIKPKGVSRAKRMSWRYLVRAHGHLAMVDVGAGVDDISPRQLRIGPSAEKMLKRIKAMEKDPKLRRHKYRLQMLRVPGLHFSSLWFKGDTKKRHIFMPLESLYKRLRIGRFYNQAEIESSLRPEAERVLSFEQ